MCYRLTATVMETIFYSKPSRFFLLLFVLVCPGLVWFLLLNTSTQVYVTIYETFQSKNIPKISTHRFCYTENSSIVVFIHLTNKTDQWHPLEMCAFKTAALMNNDTGVCVLTLYPMQEHKALAGLENLEITDLDINRIFEGTPLANWYEGYVINDTDTKRKRFLVWELSDALRYAYLYKYGGKYMDTDSWTLKKLAPLNNVAGWSDRTLIANGVLFFEKGHPLIEAVLLNFTKHFSPGHWGSGGPQLVTAMHRSGLIDNSTYKILDPYIFFPLYYTQNQYPFSPAMTPTVKDMIKNAYAMHLYRFMVMDYYKPDYMPPNGSFVYEFLHDVCL